DYGTASAQADGPLREAGLARTAKWNGDASADKETRVYGVWIKQTGISPPGDVVNTEPKDGTFTITATGTATAYRVSNSQPQAAATASLRGELATGMTFDNDSVAVNIVLGPTVGETGVKWRVSAKAQQYSGVDAAQMKAALTGRSPDEVETVAAARGFKKLSVETWPSWWPLLPELERIARDEHIDALVIGLPLTLRGEEGHQAERVRRFATAAEKLGLPVRLYDERHTSSEAEIRGASDIDAGAATILLEDFLAQLAR